MAFRSRFGCESQILNRFAKLDIIGIGCVLVLVSATDKLFHLKRNRRADAYIKALDKHFQCVFAQIRSIKCFDSANLIIDKPLIYHRTHSRPKNSLTELSLFHVPSTYLIHSSFETSSPLELTHKLSQTIKRKVSIRHFQNKSIYKLKKSMKTNTVLFFWFNTYF